MQYEVIKQFWIGDRLYKPEPGATLWAEELGPFFSIVLSNGCLRAVNPKRRADRDAATLPTEPAS